MTEHTKLPWRVVPTVGLRNDAGFIVFLKDKPSYYQGQDERYKKEIAEWEGNLEYIVRACNSHKDLLVACKELFLRVTIHYARHQEICKLGDACPDKKALRLGEAAIKQAASK